MPNNNLENDANMTPETFAGQTGWDDPSDSADISPAVETAPAIPEPIAEIVEETPVVAKEAATKTVETTSTLRPVWVHPDDPNYADGVDPEAAETRPRGRRPQNPDVRVLMVPSDAPARTRKVAAAPRQKATTPKQSARQAPKVPQSIRDWRDIADELREAEDRVNSLRAELTEALG